ncbi:MAG: SRPBCC domain-containing protein, partial [Rhodobacter sp.]|nr:SRPBCC domain-containing protein [Rhodobacter sp.]
MMPDLDPNTDLSFTRRLSVPRQLIWDCWTQPRHIPHFFIPAPNRVTSVDIDLRVGGRFNTTFDVDGTVMDNKGIYLE